MPKNNQKSNKQNKQNQSKQNQQNQSKQNQSKNIDKIDDETFDEIIKDYKAQNDIIAQKEKELNPNPNNKTPLAEALDSKKKEEMRNKIRNAIQIKSQMRNMPSKKIISEQTDELKKMMKHPKMTNNILELYGKAIAYDPKNKLPKPTDIFENVENYRAEYYQYILGLIKSMKEQNVSITQLGKILDNPYGHYMSVCIGCPLNPFSQHSDINTRQVSEAIPEQVSEANPETVSEQVSEAIPEQVSEANPETVSEAIPEQVSEAIPEQVSEANPETVSEVNKQENLEEEIKKRLQEELSNSNNILDNNSTDALNI
jgi:hypothetical protein